ncbi:uncharacterized protein [Argopecten irradians]|uniref:uncharacterized protein n=1 Tax=Argopecten irradians TaxID=31199 RepID=UPI0037191C4A
MSKSDSCLEHLDSRRNSGMEGETGKPSVTWTGHYQVKQSNGDVQNPLRQTVGDDNVDQIKGLTNLGPRRAWEELNNSEDYKEVMTNFADSMTKEEHDKTTLIRHIGVPTKTPTSRPSPGRSRPTCPPCAVRINGKWVNLNTQPNIFVRIQERVARFFRRLNRWYDDAMLDFVVIHAKNQVHRRQEKGFRQ